MLLQFQVIGSQTRAEIILAMGSANERRRYNVTSSLIGWPILRMIPGSMVCSYHSCRRCDTDTIANLVTSSSCCMTQLPESIHTVDTLMKNACFVSFVATIQTNIWKFYSQKEAIIVIWQSKHCCCVTLAAWQRACSQQLSLLHRCVYNRLFHGTMGCLCSGKIQC